MPTKEWIGCISDSESHERDNRPGARLADCFDLHQRHNLDARAQRAFERYTEKSRRAIFSRRGRPATTEARSSKPNTCCSVCFVRVVGWQNGSRTGITSQQKSGAPDPRPAARTVITGLRAPVHPALLIPMSRPPWRPRWLCSGGLSAASAVPRRSVGTADILGF